MPGTLPVIQTAAAVVTAFAAVGIFGSLYQLFRLVKEHDRVLHGEDAVEGWNGIVGLVQENNDRVQANKECITKLKKRTEPRGES